MTITDRDKKMLLLLLTVIIFGVIYVAVYTPLMTKYDETSLEYNQKKNEYDMARLYLDSIDSLKERNVTLKEDAKAKAENFFLPFQENIVETVNSIFHASGLGYTGIGYGKVNAKAILTKAEAVKNPEYPLGKLTETINSTLLKVKGEQVTPPKSTTQVTFETCEAFKVNISFQNTSYNQLMAFIREFEALNKVFVINSLSFSSQQQSSGGSIDIEMFTAPLIME